VDKNGQPLAYVYFENEPGRRAAANLLDARRGPPDRGEHRQAAGAVASAGKRKPAVKRGLNGGRLGAGGLEARPAVAIPTYRSR
jgi:hypothetical protein